MRRRRLGVGIAMALVISARAAYDRVITIPKRLFPALATLVAVVMVVAGCGGGSGDHAQHLGRLTVASLPAIDDAPLYIARERGLFKQQGLDVTIKMFQASPQAIPGLKRGNIDIVFGNYTTFFQAQAQHALDVRILSEGSVTAPHVMGVMVMPKSPIQSIKDLAGKKIAVLVQKNFQQLTLSELMSANNVDPSHVTWEQLPLPQTENALATGKVDAAYLGEPYVTHAGQHLGARFIVDPATAGSKDWPVSGYFATAEWTAKHPAQAAAFNRAMVKAQTLAADRSNVEKVLPLRDYLRMDKGTAQIITLDTYPTSTNAVRLQRVADKMYQHRWLTAQLPVASLIPRFSATPAPASPVSPPAPASSPAA